MNPKKIAVISVRPATGETGGAERFCQGLTTALNQKDLRADIIEVVSDEACFETIEESYLRFYDLDLSDYFAVISTKAPAYMIRHRNHICYLQHTMRVFYDMFDVEFPNADQARCQQREFILNLDTAALQASRIKKKFVISKEVQKRLFKYNNLPSEVLYQASTLAGFYCNKFNSIFMSGRLHHWKRVDLIIKAMRFIKSPLNLLIAGIGAQEEYLRSLAKDDSRIMFLGRVDDATLISLYADALVVPFVPIREDFGLITLEAFLSQKPIITCEDSGEPTLLVKDGESGFICPPEPQAIAQKIEWLCDNPKIAAEMGRKGFNSIRHITWEHVGKRLIEELCRT